MCVTGPQTPPSRGLPQAQPTQRASPEHGDRHTGGTRDAEARDGSHSKARGSCRSQTCRPVSSVSIRADSPPTQSHPTWDSHRAWAGRVNFWNTAMGARAHTHTHTRGGAEGSQALRLLTQQTPGLTQDQDGGVCGGYTTRTGLTQDWPAQPPTGPPIFTPKY